MSRTDRFSWRQIALIAAAGSLMVTAGCRQFGSRSSQAAPTPLESSAPSFSSPSDSTGPMLPEIPPPPPAAASTYDPSALTPPRTLGWSLPKAARTQPVAGIELPPPPDGFHLNEAVEVASALDDTANDDEEDLTLLLPPEPASADDELVPSPSDAEDDLDIVPSSPVVKNVVELDVTEFLVELDQTPAPIKAQAMLEPKIAPAIPSTPVISSPQPIVAATKSIEAWSPEHGIVINPGPTGTGNRLEQYPSFANPWNTSRVGGPVMPPAWSSMNSWAGQNSDWGGRQFR